MRKTLKIKHLQPGTIFDAGPVNVKVLEHFPGGKTLVITEKCIAYRPFTCQPFLLNSLEDWKPNDWRTSTLRADLNRDFLNSFTEAGGPILPKNIILAEWDLTNNIGTNNYGTSRDKVALLSQKQFEKYAEQGLLDLDDAWWLITPNVGDSGVARCVNWNGTLDNCYADTNFKGVRPAFYVESDLKVEVEEGEVDIPTSVLLEGFTTRQLVEEALRRIKEGAEGTDGDEDDSDF